MVFDAVVRTARKSDCDLRPSVADFVMSLEKDVFLIFGPCNLSLDVRVQLVKPSKIK